MENWTQEQSLRAARSLIIQGRIDLENGLDAEARTAFLERAESVWKNAAFHDVISRVVEDARNFITEQAVDMDSVFAHRAVLIVAQTLCEQFEMLSAQFENERMEADKKVDNPHTII